MRSLRPSFTEAGMKIRSAVLASWEVGDFLSRYKGPVRLLTNLGSLLRYAMTCPARRRRQPVNIPQMVEAWLQAVVGMSTAHTKDEFDSHDAKADELMAPLLAAPVAQLREFYERLRTKLKEDPRVPMLVWMGFEAWGEVVIKDAPDEGVIRLKNKLGQEISHLVEEPIRNQIPKAVARALRWRDPEQLEKVKDALEAGAKPKLVGRQSCLFLEMGRGKQKVSVML